MSTPKARTTLACGLAVLAPLSGCEPSPRPQGGTAVVVYTGAPVAANPLVTRDTYSDEMNRFLLFLPLLAFGPDLELEPRLAESWRMEGDSAVTFTLRRDVPWSDGRPTTAADVVFTIERALEPSTGYPGRAALEHFGVPAAVDSYTVRLPLRPSREPLIPLALLPVVPGHVLDTVAPEAMRTAPFNLAPVTNGPFQVVDGRPSDRWTLARNPAFPASLGGPPNLDRVVWRAVPESDAQLVELQAGEADLVSGVRAQAFARLGDRADIRPVERPTLSYTAIAWNGRRPPLNDARVRRALTMGIDRGQIVQGLRGGFGSPADGPIPPGHWAHSAASPLPHDTAAARRLLTAAGLADRDGDGILEGPDGAPFRIGLLLPAGSDFNRDLAQVVQDDLAAIGVGVDLRPQEFSTLVQTITGAERDYDAVLIGLDADPLLDLRPLYHSDHSGGPFQLAGYANPEMDAVLDRLHTRVDRDASAALFARAQAILQEEQPWTYLYFTTNLILVRERLRGVEADLRGLLHSAPRWWLEGAGAGDVPSAEAAPAGPPRRTP